MITRNNFTLLLSLVVFSGLCHSHEICIDFTGASNQQNPFCTDYNGYSCCTSQEDSDIQSVITGLALSDANCLAYITKTSCAVCDPWGAHLFGAEDSNPRDFPLLCGNYCSEFYQACGSVEINWPAGKNPFNVTSKVLSESFPTESDFCNYYKPTTEFTACYNGTKYVVPKKDIPTGGKESVCMEVYSKTRIIDLVSPHDDSGKLFAAYQNGTINVLDGVSGRVLSTLIELDTRQDEEAGLLSMEVHPKFATNGLLYVYYTDFGLTKPPCEDDDWCNGAGCSSDKTCNTVSFTNKLEEYKVGGAGTKPTLLRTIFTNPKIHANHNGGKIVFNGGYLYIGLGDGGGGNDPELNAQNLNRRCGKILRFDVDSTTYIQGRKYAVPSDNPFPTSKFPEIYAYGFRNPFRMTVDANRPAYFFVGDVGQDRTEEVDLLVKGGNYGWPLYEGVQKTSKSGTIEGRISPIFEYDHGKVGGYPSVIGGFVYRGTRDACQYAKYFVADLTGYLWAVSESPVNSGAYSFDPENVLTSKCVAGNSCGDRVPGDIISFAQDDSGDIYILTQQRVLRLVEPSRCGITCNAVIPTTDMAVNSFRPYDSRPADNVDPTQAVSTQISAATPTLTSVGNARQFFLGFIVAILIALIM